jgi:hypothetical protein
MRWMTIVGRVDAASTVEVNGDAAVAGDDFRLDQIGDNTTG